VTRQASDLFLRPISYSFTLSIGLPFCFSIVHCEWDVLCIFMYTQFDVDQYMHLAFQIGKGEYPLPCTALYIYNDILTFSSPHNPLTESHTASLKAFDLCQTAASHVSTLGQDTSGSSYMRGSADSSAATFYHDNFNLRRSSPFLSSYLLNAGVTHVVTCTSLSRCIILAYLSDLSYVRQ